MSVVDDPKTFGRARLSFASVADIDEFVTTLERYERGEMTPDQWRAFRLERGDVRSPSSQDALPGVQAFTRIAEEVRKAFENPKPKPRG